MMTVDDSRWPLMVVRIVGTSSDEDLSVFLARCDEFLERPGKHAIIVDVSRAGRPPPLHRKRQVDWMRANDAALRAKSLGIGYVMTNTLVRGVLTAIMWMSPLPMPHVVVATMGDAERWATARLRAAGVHVA